MLSGRSRAETWETLRGPWDLVVVGGGITGAGILRAAAQRGVKALLLEKHDFAWGTSSRSSKLVHGGLRYLKEGRVKLTFESVRERERLLTEAPGLVEPLGFLIPTRGGESPGRATLAAGLFLYDLLAGGRHHDWLSREELLRQAPHLHPAGLTGGYRYRDAGTDDARLVLRVLFEAEGAGATACNYVAAEGLLRRNGRVAGVVARDVVTGATVEVPARAVVNATGVWADALRGEVGARPRMRPLRGSHLVFDAARLSAPEALTLMHPLDRRPLFILPWEGVTVVGTTDVDHAGSLDEDAAISDAEIDYIFAALDARLPDLSLTRADVIATFSGVRPVVGTGKANPSAESRDHVVWKEDGLLTVTGGKLTTFRIVAHDALAALGRDFPAAGATPDLDAVAVPEGVPHARRLAGRYGAEVTALLAKAAPEEMTTVPGTPYLWAELTHAARHESVVTLADLLLRRVRLGLLLRDGGAALLPRVRAQCQRLLGWDDARWVREEAAYRALRGSAYALPGRERAA